MQLQKLLLCFGIVQLNCSSQMRGCYDALTPVSKDARPAEDEGRV